MKNFYFLAKIKVTHKNKTTAILKLLKSGLSSSANFTEFGMFPLSGALECAH